MSEQPGAQSLPNDLADETIATVRRWLAESTLATGDARSNASAKRLAGVLKDPRGLDFTLGFVDRVVRPEDLRVAARNLERLSRGIPNFLPWYLRILVLLGGGFAPALPWVIVPAARWMLRRMVSHLVIDATPAKLDKSLVALREDGTRLNLNLLGEAVLGDQEADRRLLGTRELLKRDDVDYVSIKVSSVASHLSMWAFDETVDRVVERLTPLYELAALSGVSGHPKFINLDMEEYHDLDLTVAVFTRLLSQPSVHRLEAGIVLQTYLPDSLAALKHLTKWATARRAQGGAGIKVRVVKGANLAMERVDATMHGWPLATFGSKVETDTNYKRLLDFAFTPAHTDAVRVGVAGHNLFDVAFAHLLAAERGVTGRVEFEMLLGMATAQADAVRRDVGALLLYTPVVHPREFDSAISYLVRRLEENASTDNFMSGVFELAGNEQIFAREAGRFLASLKALDAAEQPPLRVQDREHPVVAPAPFVTDVASVAAIRALPTFGNEPDTDSAIAANRTWARRVIGRSVDTELGRATIAASAVTDPAVLDRLIDHTAAAGTRWAAVPAAERARLLRDAGDVLAAFRGRLVTIMANETGKTVSEGDVEVSEAVDFAHYYASQIPSLSTVVGATFVPPQLTVVTPPWNFPVAIPAGSVLAALAVGSAVIIKPAPQARRSAAVMVEALWEAGVPRDVLVLADIDEGALGQQLVAHERVGRVILTGSWDTAKLFRSWREDLPLIAETSGKNAIIVTPSADLDLAVADVVRSAFGHAGQKCSAASIVILVGSVGTSERFRRQLVDAVSSLRVGYPQDLAAEMGPLIEPAEDKLLGALTTLGEGEQWLVRPRTLDETGRLWSPGVRSGVVAGSAFHLTEYFGPVLGVMTARTLAEAIDLQNGSDFGLTAGIHSLDDDEVAEWMDAVDAGNLYVNRGITGAIVRRQPFGGWKRSSVGTGAKAGGPNYLHTLGTWLPVEVAPTDNLVLDGIGDRVARVIKRSQEGIDFPEFDRVRLAARNDLAAWNEEFGVARDVSNLGVERNVFRYRPAPVTLRLSEGASMGDLVRLVAAATLVDAQLSISSAAPLPSRLVELFDDPSSPVSVRSVTVESDTAWLVRAHAGDLETGRVRLIGGDALALAHAVEGHPDIAIFAGPVTTAGRVELLTFVHEQAVSLTAHRFGNPDPDFAELPI